VKETKTTKQQTIRRAQRQNNPKHKPHQKGTNLLRETKDITPTKQLKTKTQAKTLSDKTITRIPTPFITVLVYTYFVYPLNSYFIFYEISN